MGFTLISVGVRQCYLKKKKKKKALNNRRFLFTPKQNRCSRPGGRQIAQKNFSRSRKFVHFDYCVFARNVV